MFFECLDVSEKNVVFSWLLLAAGHIHQSCDGRRSVVTGWTSSRRQTALGLYHIVVTIRTLRLGKNSGTLRNFIEGPMERNNCGSHDVNVTANSGLDFDYLKQESHTHEFAMGSELILV